MEKKNLVFNNDDLIWRQTEPSGGNTNWESLTDIKVSMGVSSWYHIVI